MKEDTIIKFLFAITALLVFLAIGASAHAASPRSQSIVYQIRTVEKLLIWLKQKACLSGFEEFCPKPEPVVSTGHTKLIRLPGVQASMFSNERRQTDDSPCHSNGVDICAAYSEGKNPIAISREFLTYPLQLGNQVKLESLVKTHECMAYDQKVMTVMDVLSDCTEQNRDNRTRRCNPDKLISNQIDIFYPCDGVEGEKDFCIQSNARAAVFGMSCYYDVVKL